MLSKAQWKNIEWLEERRLLKWSMREDEKEARAAGRPYCRIKIRANGIIVWRGARLPASKTMCHQLSLDR
jgi:hypothetical protein